MKYSLAIILCFSLLLSGCAVGPDYERPMVETPSTWRTSCEEAANTANTASTLPAAKFEYACLTKSTFVIIILISEY